jgi:hypothetical protein
MKEITMTEIIRTAENELLQFDNIRQEIATLSEMCDKAIVNSPETLAYGKELAVTAKKIAKMIEDKRKEITKPLVDKKKEFDNFAKNLTNELDNSIKNLRNQIFSYEQEIERKRQAELRRIEEERLRKEAELRRVEAERLAKEAELTAEQRQAEYKRTEELKAKAEAEQKQLELQRKKIEAQRSTNMKKVWTFNIVNPDLVPDQFWTINEQMIKQAIAAGMREIPGVNIYQEEQLILR